jgi:serine protease
VIAVGATTENRCQAEYSNEGAELDIMAPGGGFDAANSDNPRDAASCDPGRGGREILQQTFSRSIRSFGLPRGFEGTSMAAPHVSAAAALVIGTRRLGASPAPEAVFDRLAQTAADLGPDGYDSRYGWGLLDAAAAVDPNR